MKSIEKQREAQRRYRERNLDARRQDNRERLAEYRKQYAGLSVLEVVKNVDAFWSRVAVGGADICWGWTGSTSSRGYGLYAPLPGVLLRSHRVAYALHNGVIDDSMFVCHRCDNPTCCNPAHLFLGTPKDNVDDMIGKGRKVIFHGIDNPAAKLTADQVRALYLDPRTNREIAADFGVEPSYVSLVRHRKVRASDTADLPDLPRRKPGSGSTAYRRTITG